jgi:hypothetical protein
LFPSSLNAMHAVVPSPPTHHGSRHHLYHPQHHM